MPGPGDFRVHGYLPNSFCVTKKKLIHFQENLTFPFLFQLKYIELQKGFSLKGCWNENFFGNENPLILELGCGKGEYTVGLAQAYPEKNFIGIDIKGARLWRGCRTVKDKNLGNVAFIRSMVDQIESYFSPGEVSEIWITFPDPQPGKERKRLSCPRFLEIYRKIMNPDGIIRLKTDEREFYNYTLGVIRDHGLKPGFATDDLYHSDHSAITDDVIKVRTYYENIWLDLGKKICYLRFCL